MSVIDTRLADIDRLEAARQKIAAFDPQRARELAKERRKLQMQLDADLAPLMKLCEPWQPLK